LAGFEAPERDSDPEEDIAPEDGDDEGEALLALGAITHWWLSARAFLRRAAARFHGEDDSDIGTVRRSSAWRRAAQRVDLAEEDEARVSADGRARIEPEFFAQMVSERAGHADIPMLDDDGDGDFTSFE